MTICGDCFCAPTEKCGCVCHGGALKKMLGKITGASPAKESAPKVQPTAAPEVAAPVAEQPIELPKLSEVSTKHRYFCYCQKCAAGFENDVNTFHPRCPHCGQMMMNRPKEEIVNLVKKYGKESANER